MPAHIRELTSVWVPDDDHEALRDLIRARHDAREDLQSSRQRLVHFLLLHEIRPPQGVRNWTILSLFKSKTTNVI